MFIVNLLCFFILSVLTVLSQIWLPYYENQKEFDEPFDFVDKGYFKKFTELKQDYEWLSVAGTSLKEKNISYVMFTGVRPNKENTTQSVFTKESGVTVLCNNKITAEISAFDVNFQCNVLEDDSRNKSDVKYIPTIVRSTKYQSDNATFIHCDPLWISSNSKNNDPSGKCKLLFVGSNGNIRTKTFEVCAAYEKCVGGFSVDLYASLEDVDILFGLPFANSTKLLLQAQSMGISNTKKESPRQELGTAYNFGYSVAFAGDGSQYVALPVSANNLPYVKKLNGETFYPNIKEQYFGGFGTTLDTIKIHNTLYGAVIGAPYLKKQNLPNVGAVFLACEGYALDVIFGEDLYDYFGYSVSRLGDINSDGSDEFAVSAPRLRYDNPGKIYIYSTSKICKIVKIPLQIFQSTVLGFGTAISRSFDVNLNGWPDFFVSSLNSNDIYMFSMPKQESVSCVFQDTAVTDSSDSDLFSVKVYFKNSKIKFENYTYQIAIDMLNKQEKRFELMKHAWHKDKSNYLINFKSLSNTQDMDLKLVPFKIALRGTRSCKISDSKICYLSKFPNINWFGCEGIVKFSHECQICQSDLVMEVKQDIKGSIIYFGNSESYQRHIELTIYNRGPSRSNRAFLLISSTSDLSISKIFCNAASNIIAQRDQSSKIVIKDSLEIKLNSDDDIKVFVNLSFTPKTELNVTASVYFQLWGINNDNDLLNNNQTVHYKVLFRPNVTFSSRITEKTIFYKHSKPPYLEPFKKVETHELGPNLHYSFLIENKGPELKNVTFIFSFPYKFDDGKFILFLMNKIRRQEKWIAALPSLSRHGKSVGSCYIPKEMINPFNLTAMETHIHEEFNDQIFKMESDIISDFVKFVFEEKQESTSQDRTTIIKCNSMSKKFKQILCGEVVCNLDILPMASTVNFDFRSWLYAQSFFDYKIDDIQVMSTLHSNIGDVRKGTVVYNNLTTLGPIKVFKHVIFSKMKVVEYKVPLWIYIVSALVGLFILVIIIVVAYHCGFFKRKRLKKDMEKKQKRQNTNGDNPLLN